MVYTTIWNLTGTEKTFGFIPNRVTTTSDRQTFGRKLRVSGAITLPVDLRTFLQDNRTLYDALYRACTSSIVQMYTSEPAEKTSLPCFGHVDTELMAAF